MAQSWHNGIIKNIPLIVSLWVALCGNDIIQHEYTAHSRKNIWSKLEAVVDK